MQLLKLKDIRIDGGTQPRVAINNELVNEYSEAMLNEDQFPAMGVVFDGAEYWLYDGFHRYHGAEQAGLDSFNVEVVKGTVMTARWLSITTNKDHGLRRTNEDKQKAVNIALEMKPDMSDRALAQHCGVGHAMVSRMRKQLSQRDSSPQKTTKREGLDGKIRKMPALSSSPPPEKVEQKREVDRLGRYIPDVCIDIWNRRQEIQEHLTMLSKVRTAFAKGYESKDLLYKGANATAVKASLDRAYGALKCAMPFVVCPTCQGHGSCRSCEDKGMISQYLWDTVVARETKADIENLIKEQD